MADAQECLIFFVISLISIILFRKLLGYQSTNHPPGPLAIPVIGHLHLLASSPQTALYKLSKRYGPVFRIFLGSTPCVVASSPEMAREFLRTHEISFSNRPRITAVDYITYGSQDLAFAPYGPYWKFLKKLCMSQLLGAQTLDLLLPVRREEIKHMIESLSGSANAGKAVDIRGELVRLTNNVISRMVMSKRCSGDDNEAREVRKLIQEASELCGKFNSSDLFWFCKNLDLQRFGKKLKNCRDRFSEMMDRIIKEHQDARKNRQIDLGDAAVKDLLDILIDISEDESSELRLTEENIKAFVMDMFTAGSDTSASAIEWALSELINHPSVMKKAVQEIDLVVGRNRLVEESDIAKLPYLQAIIKETLRLHPPAGPFITRESTENCIIGGYNITANTRLLVNVWAIGRDPNYWENPSEFQPERFLTDEGRLKSQLDIRGQIYHLLPFGSGRRSCPGTSLAMQLVQTSLAAMIQCFEWNVDGKVDMQMQVGVSSTLTKANHLVCFPVARFSPLPPM